MYTVYIYIYIYYCIYIQIIGTFMKMGKWASRRVEEVKRGLGFGVEI
jgi:hypothetical protein